MFGVVVAGSLGFAVGVEGVCFRVRSKALVLGVEGAAVKLTLAARQ